jgi:hypothetical protein
LETHILLRFVVGVDRVSAFAVASFGSGLEFCGTCWFEKAGLSCHSIPQGEYGIRDKNEQDLFGCVSFPAPVGIDPRHIFMMIFGPIGLSASRLALT